MSADNRCYLLCMFIASVLVDSEGGMDCVNEALTCIMNLIIVIFSSSEIIMEFISFVSLCYKMFTARFLVASSISFQNSQEEI